MSKLLEEMKGDPKLDGTITVKINKNVKDELISFASDNGLSLGKMIRKGLELVMTQVEQETYDEASGD